MAEYHATLIKHCKLQAKGKNWDLPGAWDSVDNGAVAARVALEMAIELPDGINPIGDDEKAIALRKAIVAVLKPMFNAGAPVNFRRNALVEMGIAPKMESEKRDKDAGRIF
jgi:hypothetical protein